MGSRSWNAIRQVSILIGECCTTLLIRELSSHSLLLLLHLRETQARIVVDQRGVNLIVASFILRRDITILHNCLVKALVHSLAENLQDFGRFLGWVPLAELYLFLPTLIHFWLHRSETELFSSVALGLAWQLFAENRLQEIPLRQERILELSGTFTIQTCLLVFNHELGLLFV